MKTSNIVLGALLVLGGLPLAAVTIAAVSFHVLDRANGTIVSSGERREYLLHVPQSYDTEEPAPLVISLHGAAAWPAHQMETSQWNQVADEHGFLVVYPSGAGGFPKVWRARPGPDLTADVRFISDLIDMLEATYDIDPTRIYADGLSNGGGMAFALSCTLPHRIAAIGAVAAAQTLPGSWCPDPRPMPLIAFHGTADRIVPYEGGTSWASPRPFPSVPAWTERWARRNRCARHPLRTVVAADVTRIEYSDCAHGAAVVLYTVEGGGHSWPGGGPMPEWLVGPTSQSIDATHLMWAFFREHRSAATRTSARARDAGG